MVIHGSFEVKTTVKTKPYFCQPLGLKKFQRLPAKLKKYKTKGDTGLKYGKKGH